MCIRNIGQRRIEQCPLVGIETYMPITGPVCVRRQVPNGFDAEFVDKENFNSCMVSENVTGAQIYRIFVRANILSVRLGSGEASNVHLGTR